MLAVQEAPTSLWMSRSRALIGETKARALQKMHPVEDEAHRDSQGLLLTESEQIFTQYLEKWDQNSFPLSCPRGGAKSLDSVQPGWPLMLHMSISH